MRLSDVDALKQTFCAECARTQCENCSIDYHFNHAPTIDAVEVVRCKYCVYSYPFAEEELKASLKVGEWRCEFWYAEMHADDYCSCGKRREYGKID